MVWLRPSYVIVVNILLRFLPIINLQQFLNF